MRHHTVISVQVSTTAGRIKFIANKAYDGIILPPLGATVTMSDHGFAIVSVDWDISQKVARIILEPIALDEEEVAPFRREWELWGGEIDDAYP
jgi:hypothetical protein